MIPRPSDPESSSPFAGLGLSEAVLEALAEAGYDAPSPIQERAIPPLLAGEDLLGQAQTGTGKTAAFALPILSRIERERRAPQALVLVPTRELALQVAEAFRKYAAKMPGFRVLAIYGGQAYERQLGPLARGVHVVVGTPGRVMDHMRRGTLTLDGLSTLVLDEADEMLRMGFLEDVEWILDQSPEALQIVLLSATLPDEVRRIAQRHLEAPAEVSIELRSKAAESVRQRFCVVSRHRKVEALARVLDAEAREACIVFVKTKTATVALAEELEARGYACAALNGDVPQAQRERTVERLKQGRLDVLVATDVAARGLDVDRISHVVNFDMPHDGEAYVHRIGRTGRAGRKGEAILFVTPREQPLLRAIERVIGERIVRMPVPRAADVNARRVRDFKDRIVEALASDELGALEALVEEVHEETGVPLPAIAAALAVMARGDGPLLLPEGEDPAEAAFDGPRGSGHARGPERFREPRRPRRREAGMETFRAEVGQRHGVRHGTLVAAIANGAGIAGKLIGRIEIRDDHSLVDLPRGLPEGVLHALEHVRIRGRALHLRRPGRAFQARG